MIEDVDTDGNGNIEFEEFCQLMAKKGKESDHDSELQEVFKIFDKNDDSLIDATDLMVVFQELGEDVSDEDCKIMIDEHDKDEDGMLDFDEFVSLMLAS